MTGKENIPSKVWTTERVNDLLSAVEAGKVELTKYTSNPFWDSNTNWRAADIVFEYTPEEVEELRRCSEDVLYFANNYAYAMTDDGVQNITLRDYQEDALLTMHQNNKCVWLASRQIGKAQPLGASVWAERGRVSMGSLKVGDRVWNADGKLHNVIGVFPQGELEVFRIRFDDGSIVECCKDHLWEVFCGGVEHVMSTGELIAGMSAGREYSVRACAPIPFDPIECDRSMYEIGFGVTEEVPKWMRSASPEQKLAFLSGAIDAAGRTTRSGNVIIDTNDPVSAMTLLSVCETLGMKGWVRKGAVTIVEPDFTLSSRGSRTIKSITYSGMLECQCISVDSPDHLYLTDHCVPTHNTIVSGIFLTWYLIFHTDKNLMVLANVGSTTKEIISKLKVIMSNLPFFMKPGIYINNQMEMSFDNGCRLFGRATTKTAAIGFAVHFLYVDEFAHIPPSFIDAFWRSVYPTLSANKSARCIVTSTPNGKNKFYDIYTAALIPKDQEGASEFVPMRVDYWQVPGRDDVWRQKEIASLGSLEDFNQEYGLQFTTGARLLIDSDTMRSISSNSRKYLSVVIPDLEDLDINYSGLGFHPNFDIDAISDRDRFVVAVDTAGGGGGDFSVLNIFKIGLMPLRLFQKMNPSEENEAVSAVQVGIFRSNKTSIADLTEILQVLVFNILGVDRTKIALELDHRGAIVLEKMTKHPKFYDDIFVHTRHNKASKRLEPGIKYNFENKYEYCTDLKTLARQGRIVITEKATGEELGAFGEDSKGSYSCQVGHDDAAMTCVSMSAYFKSDQFYEQSDDIMGMNLMEPYIEHVKWCQEKMDSERPPDFFG